MKTFNTFYGAMLVALVALTTIGTASAQDTIVNQDTQPVPVKEIVSPGTTPFQLQLSVNMPPGKSDSDSLADFGQRGEVTVTRVYVVEHVGFQGSCTDGAAPDVAFGLNVQAAQIQSPSTKDMKIIAGKTSTTVVAAGNYGVWGSSPMRVYLPLGTIFSGYAVRNGQNGTCAGTISVSGYVQRVPWY
jgi:hypothetical protein